MSRLIVYQPDYSARKPSAGLMLAA